MAFWWNRRRPRVPVPVRHVVNFCDTHGHFPVQHEGRWKCANCADLYPRS